ncbi:MAG: hypothetical protein ACD_11C00070G0003 [uncultured bacterium]|nr:MAG: hypothetical protein ACD_11C00070G0003 [uncultured bacterium]
MNGLPDVPKEFQPRQVLPPTYENIHKVTSIVFFKEGRTTFLVEYGIDEDLDYDVLGFSENGLINGGDTVIITVIIHMMRSITGQAFDLVCDNKWLCHYRRHNFHLKVLEFEKEGAKKEIKK